MRNKNTLQKSRVEVEENMGVEVIQVTNSNEGNGKGKSKLVRVEAISNRLDITKTNIVDIPIGLVRNKNSMCKPTTRWKRLSEKTKRKETKK